MKTKAYFGVLDPDGKVIDCVHVTALDDQCAPWMLADRFLSNPYRATYHDNFNVEWVRLPRELVEGIRAEREGACWCEIVAATRSADAVKSTEQTGERLRWARPSWVELAADTAIGVLALVAVAVILWVVFA